MRTLLFGLATLLPAVAAAGEPLLVPDFTPASTSEFSLAFLLQDRVIASLEGAGHVVLTSDVVRPRVGAVVDACADTPACPIEPLRALPARVAVVVRIERRDAALIGLVTFALSGAGVVLGRLAGDRFGVWAERAGGLILIALGCKILAEHTGWL
jgi:hypothetical protein